MSAVYPRTYRVDAGARRTIEAICLLLIAIVAGGLTLSLSGLIHNPNPPARLATVAGAIAVGAVGVIAMTELRRVTLYDDAIESVWRFTPRRMARDDIAARRMGKLESKQGVSFHYILIDKAGGELRLPPDLAYDKAFHAWMASIPLRPQGT